ncbi:MAG TPA: hypothetical protein VMW12_02815 [Candidatus Dormibacteraeota bacterium]|nr:hypothetical protein [Candidatus Dormibacteraeota bacterium]
MNRDTTPEPPNPNAVELDKELENAMAVYSDTDMDPNRDDQKDVHHGAESEK